MLGINDKQPITIIERLRTANHQPVIYCLDKIAEDYLTCSDYQVSDGSMLNAIETNTGHKVASKLKQRLKPLVMNHIFLIF